MKKLIIPLIIVYSCISALNAMRDPNQHLSLEEFRAKRRAFITEKAGLTEEEAAKFFPAYLELQDQKKQLNDEAWKLLRSGKDDKTTDAQYEEILEGVHDVRIASDRLGKTYFEKFKRILPYKKIHLIQRTEMRSHRGLLRGVRDNKGKKK